MKNVDLWEMIDINQNMQINTINGVCFMKLRK